jgi:hypothetical protein
MEKEIKLEVDLDRFRYSLVGDGYLLEEVEDMTEEKLISILEMRIYNHIEESYQDGKKMGLFNRAKIKL